MTKHRLVLLAFLLSLLASPALAAISPVSNTTATATPTLNASSAGVGNLTKNITVPDVAQAKAPVEIPRKLFFTVVVLFGGFILMGVALDKPGGFAKFRTGFLVVLGGGLVLAGVLFGVM